LAAARGDDGATGARTHAQPEAVDLSATPVVRLKRTLAHLRLQGRVRKYIRQTPRICGVLHCLCAVATSPVSDTPAQADHRYKHKEDTAWASPGQIGPAHVPLPRTPPTRREALLAGFRGPVAPGGKTSVRRELSPAAPQSEKLTAQVSGRPRTRSRRTCGHRVVHNGRHFHIPGSLWITSTCG